MLESLLKYIPIKRPDEVLRAKGMIETVAHKRHEYLWLGYNVFGSQQDTAVLMSLVEANDLVVVDNPGSEKLIILPTIRGLNVVSSAQ